MTEYVYVLTNPRMPDLIKIGRTENIDERLKTLYKTGVPLPFQPYCCYEVKNSKKVEKAMHKAFKDNRINPNREFFRISPESAEAMLEALQSKKVILEDDGIEKKVEKDAVNKENSRDANINFKMLNIRIGSELTFLDDDSITANVIENKKIKFEGKETSLSGATKIILKRRKEKRNHFQGSLYWRFKGKTLQQLRLELNEKE